MATATRKPASRGAGDAPPPPRGFAGRGAPTFDQLLASTRAPRPSRLRLPLTTLPGVGPKLADAAAEAGLSDIGALLLRLPHSHRDHSDVLSLEDLRLGEEATVLVQVKSASLRPTRRRGLKIVEAQVSDGTGAVKATWFNQAWLAEKLTPGTRLLMHGKLDRRGFRVKTHEVLAGGAPAAGAGGGSAPSETAAPAGLHTTGLVPVHPATEAIRPQRLREWAWRALEAADEMIEPLPARLRARRSLASVAAAIRAAHFPASPPEADEARRRLAFEELLLHQVALATRRNRRRTGGGSSFDAAGDMIGRWIESLPFAPTGDQTRAFAEIDEDLASGTPMQRLLMGEVGSGKTVVALYAMLRALENGRQAALMAPTETLAEQHALTLDRLLAGEPVSFALLTGSTPKARRREALDRLASGELSLVVGTHALAEPTVKFARLGVCVVDEQHRFGVGQRAALDAKGSGQPPHVLHMTATPIPRTLSLTAYGDLDTTQLRQLPAGRPPVRTWLVDEDRRAGAYEFLRERLREGRQAFVVCPLVSESEKITARAASAEASELAAGELCDFRVGLLHGQMASAEKAAAMARFAAGETDVLVATSVIEVGIDVPNATVMVIEGAERYGVSQLHQLRGRVGRGTHESFCLLFPDEAGELARRRLRAVADERDGFRLAEVDLSLRGEGEILGTRQHGLPRFAVASLPEDAAELIAAREDVLALLGRYGSLSHPALGPLLDAARERFGVEEAGAIPA